jgi:hypothetical protein
VKPDIEAKQSVDDYLNKRDAVLEKKSSRNSFFFSDCYIRHNWKTENQYFQYGT